MMWRHISPSSHNLQVVPTLEAFTAEQRKGNESSLESNMMLNIPLQREFISEAPKKTTKPRRSGTNFLNMEFVAVVVSVKTKAQLLILLCLKG